LESRLKRDRGNKRNKLTYYSEYAPTIKVPFALGDMKEDMHEETLESICDVELAEQSPQCFSAKFVDKDDQPILFYFGFRQPHKINHVGLTYYKFKFNNSDSLKKEIPLEDQYKKRTMEYMEDYKRKNPDTEFFHDGLTVRNIIVFFIFSLIFFLL
jgi:hypothetical protein